MLMENFVNKIVKFYSVKGKLMNHELFIDSSN